MLKFYFAILIIGVSQSSFAEDFKCKVISSVKLENNGRISSTNTVAVNELGKEFTVNRLTGIMSGSGFVNNMSGVAPTVFNYIKSEGNSYSAITIYKPNYTIDFLEIKEFVEGSEKPFLYRGAWGELVTGLCEYY